MTTVEKTELDAYLKNLSAEEKEAYLKYVPTTVYQQVKHYSYFDQASQYCRPQSKRYLQTKTYDLYEPQGLNCSFIYELTENKNKYKLNTIPSKVAWAKINVLTTAAQAGLQSPLKDSIRTKKIRLVCWRRL